MNRTFVVIISIATILLVVLLIILSLLRSQPKTEETPNQTAFPTDVPRRVGYSKNSNKEVPTVSKEDLDILHTFQSKLPYETDTLAIDYSSLTNKVYLEEKNENAELELETFLKANGLKELYDKKPALFVKTKSNIKKSILEEEQILLEDEEDLLFDTSPTPTLNPNDPSRDIKPVLNTFKALMGFNTVLTPLKGNVTATRPGQNGTSSQPAQGAAAQIVLGPNTTNIPCAAGTDNGVADGYRNGVLSKIRLCRVHGSVVNSQISKQYNDLHAAAAASGIIFGGGSFRTMGGQINTYQRWCKNDGIVGSPPPYPKPPGQTIRCPGGGAPGYSNHQMGLAIDFNCDGALLPRSFKAASKNRCFQWLLANAGKYGFYEYGYGKTRDGSTGYEGWHWSVNGN